MEISDFWGEQWARFEHEYFKPEDHYEVSNYGRVKRKNPKTESWELVRAYNGKKDGTDYDFFCLTRYVNKKKKRVSKPIHRLVAEFFCEQPSPEHKFVIHLNYVKTNNHYKNLAWATQKELTEHNQANPKVLEGREKNKGKTPNAKLTETEVIRIKKRLKRGKRRLYKIAEEFGITHTQLNRIRSGENWGHISVD